ncbi:MAG: sodium:proton antiporter [Gammaproteobacteria bacterium]|nr:sodium:proton antiporter [Gammaproteobacteria bacterium]
MEHHLVQVIVTVAFAGMLSQWLAWRFKVPAIVLLTLMGLLLGPVSGLLDPDQDFGALLRPLVQLSVAVILFEGGLSLRLKELEAAGAGVRRLVTLGPVINWVLGAGCARYVGGLDWPVAMIFGAIIVVTGPTVIMPLLRQARLRKRSASILKWEGIVNDPTGALMAVVLYEYFTLAEAGVTGAGLAGELLFSIVLATLMGVGTGLGIGCAFRGGHVPEFLKGPITVVAAVVVFGLANAVQEDAGLVATTVLGLVIGNLGLPSIEEIRRYKEYITILLVSALFIILTANIDPRVVALLSWRDAALIFSIVFVVRPIAIMLATAGADMEMRDRLLAAWIAPRGIVAAAVAAAFAPGLMEAGFADGEKLIPLIFGLIIVTVCLHGFSIGWVARRLGVASKHQNGVLIVGASPWSIDLADKFKQMEVPVLLADASWHRLRKARLAGVPIYFGNAASEAAESAIDINEIGCLLAATDNDAYNALICTRFANELGRQAVYQLPTPAAEQSEHRQFVAALTGRVGLGAGAIYEELLQRYFQGWRFSRTRLTEQYSFEDYCIEACREKPLAMLMLRAGGQVVLSISRDQPPKEGDTIVNFTLPVEKPADRQKGDQATTS